MTVLHRTFPSCKSAASKTPTAVEEGRNALELGDEILGLALSLASLSLGGLGQCLPLLGARPPHP